MKIKNKELKSGDLVHSVNNNCLGILIEESNIHQKFWHVFTMGKVNTWNEFNVKKVCVEKKEKYRAE